MEAEDAEINGSTRDEDVLLELKSLKMHFPIKQGFLSRPWATSRRWTTWT